MSGSVPIQIRGTPSNGPPVGLVERQLAVEMNNGNLWVGVPVSIDPTGRIQLNPRRIPAGGERYDTVSQWTAGGQLVWTAVGDRPGNSTAAGWQALMAAGSGTNNTALGNIALRNLTSGDYNVAVGNSALRDTAGGRFNVAVGADAAMTATAGEGSVFIGYAAVPQVATSFNEIVIGANTTGHGSNTATIGVDSGPNVMTQLWCGGRDLLRVGQPPAFNLVTGSLTGVPNDDSVHDMASFTLDAGIWMVVLKCSFGTGTNTPWIHYAAGVNTAAGQSSIWDAGEWRTAAGSAYMATFSYLTLLRPAATTTFWACLRAQNATNSGTWDGGVSVEPIRLG